MAGLECNTFSFSFFCQKNFNLTQNKLRKKNTFTFHFGSNLFSLWINSISKGWKVSSFEKKSLVFLYLDS